MTDHHVLPLDGTISDGQFVRLAEVQTGFLTQLAGWDNFHKAASDALGKAGLSVPESYRSPVCGVTSSVMRIAPNRVLVWSEKPADVKSNDDIVVLDLSDARRCVAINGTGAEGLLSRVIAIEFSEVAFPVGTFAQAGLHHVGVLIRRTAKDAFTILIPTTWTTSLVDLLARHITPTA